MSFGSTYILSHLLETLHLHEWFMVIIYIIFGKLSIEVNVKLQREGIHKTNQHFEKVYLNTPNNY